MTTDTITDFEKVDRVCRSLLAATFSVSNLDGYSRVKNLVFREEVFKRLHLISCAIYLVKTYNICTT